MKQHEIKPCSICGRGVMHTKLPLFYRVTVERFGIEIRAVERQHGLEQFFGGGQTGAVLAHVMGEDADMARPVMDKLTLIICEACAMETTCVAQLAMTEARDGERKTN